MVAGIFCGISWKRSRHLLLFSSDILTDLKDMMTISQLEKHSSIQVAGRGDGNILWNFLEVKLITYKLVNITMLENDDNRKPSVFFLLFFIDVLSF